MATDVPQLAGAASTLRAPTQQERETALGIVRGTFARKGALGKVAVQNLAAGDLDNDSSHELIGSVQVVRQ